MGYIREKREGRNEMERKDEVKEKREMKEGEKKVIKKEEKIK